MFFNCLSDFIQSIYSILNYGFLFQNVIIIYDSS